MTPLLPFHQATRDWFAATLGTPTPAQTRGWRAIGERRHTLVAAPTGSGKTLAAFLTILDDLLREGLEGPLPDEVRVIYVSPLKALSVDIEKNLAAPRLGLHAAARALGLTPPEITVAVRTGDTPARERAAMLRRPPHILVTTPESLYLLLTSTRSRAMLRTARTVIVDEIHAVIGSRRGAHLALTLERLQQICTAPLLRIGLSATQRPIDDVARYLVGSASPPAAIVDEGHQRTLDLGIEVPRSPLEAVMSHEVWGEYYDRLTALINAHTTTLVFVNTRRMAERVARQLSERLGEYAVTAHHGSLSKERRLEAESRLKQGRLRALVATASLELGIDIGHVDLVCQIGSPHRIATLLQRVGRSGHTVAGTPKGRVFPVSRDDLVECIALLRAERRGDLDAIVAHDAPLDVLSQQIVAETACEEYDEDALFALVRRAWPYRELTREAFDGVLRMTAEGFATRRGRRGALLHRDEVHRRVRGRRGARSLAITSGGAIPDVADYRVVLDPEDTFIGTLNEDFAIESHAGDVIQLGNASWQIVSVGPGVVRVADAGGAPPTLPFWLGEAPGRSRELSRAVSDLRRDAAAIIAGQATRAASEPGHAGALAAWLERDCGVSRDAAEQAAAYLTEAHAALGVLPTEDTLVLERFFDESGGMQLVLHAPVGSRITRAWGLALRKRFCRQFNFELQAAATEEGLLLSLGPQHSFPLADVFRYLHPATARDVLVQAFLDAPVFQTRWRWNTTIALAVPRNRHGKKVAPPLQRMLADDLLAAAFPDAAACLENIPGDREIPDHPLVRQAVHDCLQEAMDFEGLAAMLERIHRGDVVCVARDTTEPSPLCHEILNAQPYAFLDDAPLEERRAHAVYTRRAGDARADDLGTLDAAAIAQVVDEAWPAPRDADELHDALLVAGVFTEAEAARLGPAMFRTLAAARRAVRVDTGLGCVWSAAERLPELQALGHAALDPAVTAPPSRDRRWPRQDAVTELVRGRIAIGGPLTVSEIATPLGADDALVEAALQALEAQGVVLRGRFRQAPSVPASDVEWCDRGLLARIHRYTINRLRAEIAPVSPAEFMRFLFEWQHMAPGRTVTGPDGLLTVLQQLDGFEIAAAAWERDVLPRRVSGYDPAWLDLLCLTGQVGWARLSSAAVATRVGHHTPIALFVRATSSCLPSRSGEDTPERALSSEAAAVIAAIDAGGARFVHELVVATGLAPDAADAALAELVGAGLVASDGFAGLRALIGGRDAAAREARMAGRWARCRDAGSAVASAAADDAAIEVQARTLVARYGVVCRRWLAREGQAAGWRRVAQVLRRLEARGEVRGGRFVSGLAGEQYASPDAVALLREVRRTPPDDRLVVLSGSDPLNLTGIVTAGERIAASTGTRVAYRHGVPVAVLEGEYLRMLAEMPTDAAREVASALTGRRLPAAVQGFVGRAAIHERGA